MLNTHELEFPIGCAKIIRSPDAEVTEEGKTEGKRFLGVTQASGMEGCNIVSHNQPLEEDGGCLKGKSQRYRLAFIPILPEGLGKRSRGGNEKNV